MEFDKTESTILQLDIGDFYFTTFTLLTEDESVDFSTRFNALYIDNTQDALSPHSLLRRAASKSASGSKCDQILCQFSSLRILSPTRRLYKKEAQLSGDAELLFQRLREISLAINAPLEPNYYVRILLGQCHYLEIDFLSSITLTRTLARHCQLGAGKCERN